MSSGASVSKLRIGFLINRWVGFDNLENLNCRFDTIKVRLQTTSPSHFKGPLDCLLQTVRNEGFRGLYKGASPPLVGWMFMDSLYVFSHIRRSLGTRRVLTSKPRMLGSLSNYRALIKRSFYPNCERLPPFGHGIAGILAGWTVSLIAAPVEHVKARLQVQYNARGNKEGMKYKGPIDCIKKLVCLLQGFIGSTLTVSK